MFGKANFKNSSVWKSLNPDFQCLEKPNSNIPMFGKAKVRNSNDWESSNLVFQCLEVPKV